jgi:hypothetical protein
MLRSVVLMGLVVALGCESPYIYRPEENATARVAGHVAARYEVPQEQPHGDVRVASFGMTKIRPQTGEGEVRALHARMVVANNDDLGPWIVDTHQQQIRLRDGHVATPAYAASDRDGLPLVTVRASEQRTIDLFYPLPESLQKESKIPEFDVLWKVQTPHRMVAERTPFERLEVVPAYAFGYGYPYGYPYGWPGWGPSFWADPFFSYDYSFYRPTWMVRSQPVIIGRPAWNR